MIIYALSEVTLYILIVGKFFNLDTILNNIDAFRMMHTCSDVDCNDV